MTLDQLPPHSLEAEEGLLSSALQYPLSDEVFCTLSPDDFYRTANKLIFGVIVDLHSNKTHIDLASVSETCQSRGILKKIGGVTGLVSIMSEPIAVNAESCARVIKTAAKARKMIETAHEVEKLAHTITGDNISEKFDLIQGLVNNVVSLAPVLRKKISIDHVYTPARMLESYQAYIKSLKNNRFLTGIHEIDKRIRGVAGGEVMTIIARAGSFKTAMLQNMLLNYVNRSAWGAIFFSLEMPVASVTERYLGITLGYEGREAEEIYLEHFKTGDQQEDIDLINREFAKRMGRIFVVPVKISLAGASEYVRLIESKFEVKIGVIGIDYIGLIDQPGKSEYETISEIARGAKEMAKEVNIPTILLSQTSRAGADGEQEVTLDMGRGSGAIEEAADFILGSWQEEIKDPSGRPTGNYDLVTRILKNRKGPKGSKWRLDLKVETLKFSGEAVEVKPEAPREKRRRKKPSDN